MSIIAHIAHISTIIFTNLTIKKLKSIDIINVLSDLVSEKLETTVKLPRYSYLAKRTYLHLTFLSERFFFNTLIIG